MDFLKMSAAEIAVGVRENKFSAVDVVSACIKRAKACEPKLNACVTLLEEKALTRAKEIDRKVQSGEKMGKLCGVPFFAKDNICTQGIRTTCSSQMLEKWVPTYDATVIELMEDADAILVGKTNMDEFAMGSSTENSFFGPTKNPRDLSRVPGGSSGGSASVVAAGYAPIALGSDTGGSVRQPAAFCGIHGFKPSYGQVSRYGVVGYASSFDQVSPFARTIEDIALVMDVIACHDKRDMMCAVESRPDFSNEVVLHKTNLDGKKIALLGGFSEKDVDPDLIEAMHRTESILKNAGAVVKTIELPVTTQYCVGAYYVLALADASAKLACFDGIRLGFHAEGSNLFDMYSNTRTKGFGEEVKKRILLGTTLLSTGYHEDYFIPATKVRTKVAEEFAALFEEYDALLMPVTPTMPYHLGEKESDPKKMYLGDIFTVPVNMAGLPGLSLNTGFTAEGLPLNVQLISSRFADAELLALGALIENVAGSPNAATVVEVE